MSVKENALSQIMQLMKSNRISAKEVSDEYHWYETSGGQFDLCCVVEGNKSERVQFDFAVENNLKVIGIYPGLSQSYLLVDEENEVPRSEVVDNILPTLKFWEIVYRRRNQINAVLAKLGKKPINGYYHAQDGTQCWVVKMEDDDDCVMKCDFFDKNYRAKVRYCKLTV